MKLTDTQISILIDAFFLTEASYPGLAEISRRLLLEGECIVAGNGQLWNGGVGSFIRVTVAKDAVGCAKLTLDREALLSTPWVKENLESRIDALRLQTNKLQEQVAAVRGLLEFATK
jgi:hypothetical protein